MSKLNLTSFIQSINWIWLVITLLVFSLLIKLGIWQSNRAIEKEQRLTRIEALTRSEPQDLSVLLKKMDNNELMLNDIPVRLKGRFEPDILFLLDNQPNQRKLGYKVYQVFNHNELKVLVNLGWVAGSVNRKELPDIEALEGDFEFVGNIRYIDIGVMLTEQVFDQVSWPLRVQQIEINKFSRLINTQLLPFAVFLDKKEAVGYEKNWQPVVMPPEKHWGYAFQWFSLAIAWLSLMIWAAIKFHKNKYNNKAL